MSIDTSTQRKIQALLRLLTDPDPQIAETIQQELVNIGEVVLPFLKQTDAEGDVFQARLGAIREDIGFATIRQEFAQLALDEEKPLDLESGTFLLARLAYPNLDVTHYTQQLNVLAEEVRPRLHPSFPLEQASQILSEYLFQEKGFSGNRDHYYDPDNSFFNRVLDRRTGIPITLSVLYLFLAKRLSLPCVGVGMPGHFVVKLEDTDPAMFIDCFNGGVFLQAKDCEQFLTEAGVGFDEAYLMKTPNALILARMIRNLIGVYEKQGNQKQLDHMNELITLLE